MLALNLTVAAAGATVLVQTVVIVRERFGQSTGVMALVLAAHGAGSMVAAVTLPRLLTVRSGRPLILAGGAVASAGVMGLRPTRTSCLRRSRPSSRCSTPDG